ncbi:MAG: Ig-like domain-containing protein [Propionibacteriaceae bacterium]|nr:Ig-like domain-containing protein [Propionibacteriaceae bacterium]
MPVTATATIRDTAGEPMSGVEVAFTAVLDPPLSETCTTADDGTCSITLTSQVAQPVYLAATVAGIPLTGSPAQMLFVPTECLVNPQDQFTVTPAGAVADGVSVVTVTADTRTPCDAATGGPMLTEVSQVAFPVPPDGVTVSPVEQPVPGVFTATLVSATPGEYTVRVTYGGNDLGASQLVTFATAADFVSSPAITVANASGIAGTAGNDVTTVTVYDESGEVICTSPVVQGAWACQPAAGAVSQTIRAVAYTHDGRASAAASQALDVVPPAQPTIIQVDGRTVTGTFDLASAVYVTYLTADGTAKTAAATLSLTGTWTFVVPGDGISGPISAVAVDKAGNTSTLALGQVTLPRPTVGLSAASVKPGATITIVGQDWVAGEQVAVTVNSQPVGGGTYVVGDDGTLPTLTYTVPTGLPAGTYTVVVTGTASGPVTATFVVTGPTGSGGVTAPTGGEAGSPAVAWLALVLLGVAGLTGARRRATDQLAPHLTR